MKTCAACLLILLVAACGGGSSNTAANAPAGPHDVSTAHPPTLEGARAVLAEFLEDGVNALKLRSQLKPTGDDLARIYQPGYVEKAQKVEDKLWDIGQQKPEFERNADQTKILVYAATTQQLRAWQSPTSQEFADPVPPRKPYLFNRVPMYVLDDLTFYRFKFVKPGLDTGAVFGALLCHINGRWVLLQNPVSTIEHYDEIMSQKK